MKESEKRCTVLELLRANARVSTEEIADRLCLEESAVAALIEAMEKSGRLSRWKSSPRGMVVLTAWRGRYAASLRSPTCTW
mgnify:CR=1 FL=1